MVALMVIVGTCGAREDLHTKNAVVTGFTWCNARYFFVDILRYNA